MAAEIKDCFEVLGVARYSSAVSWCHFSRIPMCFISLDATEHLARVSRRSVLVYCRAGLQGAPN